MQLWAWDQNLLWTTVVWQIHVEVSHLYFIVIQCVRSIDFTLISPKDVLDVRCRILDQLSSTITLRCCRTAFLSTWREISKLNVLQTMCAKVASQKVHIPVRFSNSLRGWHTTVCKLPNVGNWDLSCETMERRSAFTPVTPRHQLQDCPLISAKLESTPLIASLSNLGLFTGSVASSVASDGGLYLPTF